VIRLIGERFIEGFIDGFIVACLFTLKPDIVPKKSALSC